MYKDGETLSETEKSDFESYLLQTLPPNLFRFYFFDGEKISDFVFNSSKNSDFKDAFLKLCSLDTMEIIRENFRRISRSKAKGTMTLSAEYDKIAASISPIEAVRISTTTENEKLNTKKLRRKLTPENLAKIGFMRNHKKVILTLISLGFSGILLMSAATFLASIDEEDMARQSFGDKEFLITLSDEYSDNSLKDNPLDDSMMNLLTDSPYITDVKSIKGCSADILLPDKKEPSSFREIIGLSDDEFSSLSNNLLSEEISYQELVGKNGILIGCVIN